MYHPANPGRCKSDSFHKRGTSDWMVPLSKGSLVLAGKTPRAPCASSVLPAFIQMLSGGISEGAPFSSWTSAWSVTLHISLLVASDLLPVRPFGQCHFFFFWGFFVCFFCFFPPRGLHLVVFKKKKRERPPCVFVFSFCFSKMYNNDCTSTDWKRTL